MFDVPTDQRKLIPFTQELIETCRVSVGARQQYYRVINWITETGKYDQSKSLINLLYRHIARTAAHLFSPVELKFALDFDRDYPDNTLEQGKVIAKQVTRQWERKCVDMLFSQGVFEATKYGACILKQWPQVEGPPDKEKTTYHAKLVQPWRFGVYNESENSIEKQAVVAETASVTMPEVWRRIWHLPDAQKLYKRIWTHSRRNEVMDEPQSYFHQVLSTSQIDTSGIIGSQSKPGGVVQFTYDPTMQLMGPQVAAETAVMHELWVLDANLNDYCTILLIEPDIIVAPTSKKSNLLGVVGANPYTLIQPNVVTDWFWGRTELADLAEPQVLLSTWADDLKRIFGLQIDKILAFVGETGLDDERYAQFRLAGYTTLPQGSDVKDLTPQMPTNAMEMLKFLITTINDLAGFPPIMSGQGEQGVRAGSHANTLLKTASPTLRDRALLIERQCAIAADLTMTIREAKDGGKYWTKSTTVKDMEETEFMISDLPEDWRITVDSHSSSPIFADENQQLMFALRKTNDVDGEYLLDNLPIPNKEHAKAGLKKRAEAQQQQMSSFLKQFPEMGEKLALKQLTGGKR